MQALVDGPCVRMALMEVYRSRLARQRTSDDSSTIINANDENSCSEMSTTVFGLSALTSLVRLSTLLHSKGRARSKADGVLYLLEFSVVSFSLHVPC